MTARTDYTKLLAPCVNCGRETMNRGGGRCDTCARWLRKHGAERVPKTKATSGS